MEPYLDGLAANELEQSSSKAFLVTMNVRLLN
jgi:hypothetical protein